MKNNLYVTIDQEMHDWFIGYSNDNNRIHVGNHELGVQRRKQIVHGCHIILVLLAEVGLEEIMGIKSIHAKFFSPVYVDDKINIDINIIEESITFSGKTIYGSVFEINFKFFVQSDITIGSKLHNMDIKPVAEFFQEQVLRCIQNNVNLIYKNHILTKVPTRICVFFSSLSAYVGTITPGNGAIIGDIIVNFYKDSKYLDLTKINTARYVSFGDNFSVSLRSDSFLVRTTGRNTFEKKLINYKKLSSLVTEDFHEISDVCLVIGAFGQIGSFFVAELLKHGCNVVGTTAKIDKVGLYEVTGAGNFTVRHAQTDEFILDLMEKISKKANIKAILFCNSPVINATFSEDDLSPVDEFLRVYVQEVFKLISYCRYLSVSKIVIPGSIYELEAPVGFSSYAMIKKMSSYLIQKVQEIQDDVLIFNPKLPPINELTSEYMQEIGFYNFIDD